MCFSTFKVHDIGVVYIAQKCFKTHDKGVVKPTIRFTTPLSLVESICENTLKNFTMAGLHLSATGA